MISVATTLFLHKNCYKVVQLSIIHRYNTISIDHTLDSVIFYNYGYYILYVLYYLLFIERYQLLIVCYVFCSM